MPRTCLACASPQREEIDKALVEGVPLRNITKLVSISPAALLRHKNHAAQAIVKASEKREELLGDSLLGEMRRVQQKAWDLLAKTESEGDHRGSIVALREVRECTESLGEMLSRAPNGLDLAAISDEAIFAEAERRGLKLPLNIRVVYEEQQIRRPRSLTDDSLRNRIAEAEGIFIEAERRGLCKLPITLPTRTNPSGD